MSFVDGWVTEYKANWNGDPQYDDPDGKKKQKEESSNNRTQEVEKPKNNDLTLSTVLSALGVSMSAQNGIIDLANNIDIGTSKVLGWMKNVGKKIGILGVTVDAYSFLNQPSVDSGLKVGVSAFIALGKNVNPFVAVVSGLLDVTGLSKTLYKNIENIPSSIKNGFDQMFIDMNRAFIPSGY